MMYAWTVVYVIYLRAPAVKWQGDPIVNSSTLPVSSYS